MKGIFFILLVFVSLKAENATAAAGKNEDVYIVYMGAAASTNGLRNYHSQLLSSLRKKNALVHSYSRSFSGFAAVLSAEEASSMAKKPGVVSVFRDPILQLHTTRSWDFLKYQNAVKIDANLKSDSDSDTIIGILDTGIWPESESFNDKDMGPIPARWKGTCMKGDDFSSSNCNRKLIGARFYNKFRGSIKVNGPRDTIGHGTHVAATAAGSVVQGASYYGLAAGTAKGGSPASRIAVYRVCSTGGCSGSNILAAFDDAIADGVDVLSLSLGATYLPDIKDDPIAIGAFHAVEKGILVVCSAGNSGPDSGSVVNAAPWILTVAASTIDRDFESDVVLEGNKVFKGEAINFANIGKTPVNPIIYGKSAKRNDSNEDAARNCQPESMDKNMMAGKIVVCENVDREYSRMEKLQEVKSLGGIGLVLIDDETRVVASIYGTFPLTMVSSKDGSQILSYINSTRKPVGTILPTASVTNYKPAPAVAYFSSRGPSSITKNIIKPDIAAPGVDILAAWIGNDTAVAPEGKDPPLFNVISGTSMACPHVSGMAAAVKSRNPTWSPSAIRSAIMTTATQTNNLKAPITTETGSAATPYDFGAGEIGITGPLQPGLVYETTTIDYLNFLCFYGYDNSTIKTIARAIPEGFVCPMNPSTDSISDINYPSIAISKISVKESKKVNRTLTNVAGDDEPVYTVSIEAPAGINVKVVPDKLQFTDIGQRLSYQVIFALVNQLDKDVFGSITWSNGKYKVRSPFALSS
ncbi:hypothetical protein SLA2020_094690 [Shorea laevis]